MVLNAILCTKVKVKRKEEVVDTPFIIKRLESCGRHPRFSAEARSGGRKVRTRNQKTRGCNIFASI